MGLPIGREVSWLEAIASTITRLPTKSNAPGVGLGGEAAFRVAHASSQKALAPTRRTRWGPAKTRWGPAKTRFGLQKQRYESCTTSVIKGEMLWGWAPLPKRPR